MLKRCSRKLAWNYRQDYTGRMPGIVKNGLPGRAHFGAAAKGVPGVGIAVPTWKIRTGYVQPDTVSRLENVSGRPEIDGKLVRLARFEQFGLVAVAIPRPDNAIRQVLGET